MTKLKIKKTMKEPSETTYTACSRSGAGLTAVVSVRIQTERQIQRRTRELYLARGGQGHPLLDWLQAERELTGLLNSLQEIDPVMPETSLGPQNPALCRASCWRQCPTRGEGVLTAGRLTSY